MNIQKLVPLALLVAALAVAAPEERRERREASRIAAAKSYLNLTDAQLTSVQQMLERHRAGLEAIQKQIVEKQRGLEQAFQTGDPAVIGKLVLDTSALRKQIAQAQQDFSNQILGSLTNDQRAKVQRLLEAREAMWVLPVLGFDQSREREEIPVRVER